MFSLETAVNVMLMSPEDKGKHPTSICGRLINVEGRETKREKD